MKTSFITKNFLLIAFLVLVGFTVSCDNSCDNPDEEGYVANRTELNQAWQLIGYSSGTSFHMIDEAYRRKDEQWGYRFFLTFMDEGRCHGRDAVNEFNASYTCEDSQIELRTINSTAIGDSSQETPEFHKRLWRTTSYGIKDGDKLRLYYSENEFLYFEAIK